MAVYDKETNEIPKTHKSDDSTGGDIANKENAASSESLASNGADSSVNDEQQALSPKPETDLYNPSKSGFSPRRMLAGKLGGGGMQKKAAFAAIGAALVAVAVVVGSLFGFLNTFKLDHIMKNLERKGFQRYQVSMDGRSDKWMQAYLRIRFAEIEDPSVDVKDRENLLFRANKVDTDNPIRDWYQTLRTSKFEDDLLKKHKFMFTSVARSDGHGGVIFRAGKVTMDNKDLPPVLSDSDLKALANGTLDYDTLDNHIKRYVDVEIYDTGKEARKKIKNAVNAETHAWQVIKRRHVRKNIQNMIGIKDWRFFEKTRDKLDEKKINVRNKIIKKALPENTKAGKYIQCFFGVSSCKASTDPIDPENRSSTATPKGTKDSGRTTDPNDSTDTPVNDDGTAEHIVEDTTKDVIENESEDLAVLGLKMTIIKQIVAKLNGVAGALSLLDTLARIDQAIKNHTLVKMVTVARGTQALGLYTTFSIASDQLRTGEVTGPEVGKFMESINAVSNSEGWVDVISNNGSTKAKAEDTNDFVAAKDKEEYCSPEHQTAIQDPKNSKIAEREFHYLCGDKQIGGKSRAKVLEDWWARTFGRILGPILSIYRATHIGSILSWFGSLTDKIFGPIINIILKATGLEGGINTVISWALTEISSFLGAGPMLNGSEPSGVFLNTMLQGGSYGSEASARYQGASKTTEASAAFARQNTVAYLSEQRNQQSIFDKYFSIENDNSAISQGLFASIQDSNVNNISSLVSNFMKNISKVPLTPFSKPARAVADDPYAAANFAAIDTFDFPQECMDLDPVKMKSYQVTNANDILVKHDKTPFTKEELTWDLVNNNTDFYDAVYLKIGDEDNADEIAQQIYDCAAMDTSIRGGLGAVYGYTDDNGLESGSITDATDSTGVAGSDLKWLKKDSDNIPCYGSNGETKDLGVIQTQYDGFLSSGSPPKIRLCQITSIDGSGINAHRVPVSGGAVVASGVSENWYKLGKASQDEKNLTLVATSSFRYENSCGGGGTGGACAEPGKSPHQAGVAIDFGNMNAIDVTKQSCSVRVTYNSPDYKWMFANAERFGIYQYSAEAWHWDPLYMIGNRCDSKGTAKG